jgi:DNA polymerase-3 subunit gamma/tau
MVRYLRNTLMASLGGEKTDLLQISADERARAARSAGLFTEEEITRNLQIMLNTFDALNETQEHRFHLELGMMKMLHAQRLLPLERLLSGMSGGLPVRSPAPAGGSRTSSSAPRPAPVSSASAPPSAPAPTLVTSPAFLAEMVTPFDLAASSKQGPASLDDAPMQVVEAPETAPESARPPAVSVQITEAPTIETLRLAVISALADAGHPSAAQLLGAGSWSVDGSSLRIEVSGIGKKMLSLTVNAAAEKIIRQELQRLNAPARFLIVPGEGSALGSAPAVLPVAGSIQEAALANPLVQRAKEIFKAEVRSVVDLRTR